jgi:hypothetical protein
MTVAPACALSELKHLLLDLIAPVRPVVQSQLDGLSPQDWGVLMGMVRQHRLGPLLDWQLAAAHTGLRLPQPVKVELVASRRQAALLSLRLQGELLRVHCILQRALIPHVALKGSFLAWHAYPEPGLRPLRDLDILVPGPQALAAYQSLIDGGLLRIEKCNGTPEAAAELNKHLPMLMSPSVQVPVELHVRLYAEYDGKPGRDWSNSPEFWQRCTPAVLAGKSLPFESPTDLLLHLIVHAVHDHGFNNGPLLMSDIAFLLRRQAIDWPLFWGLAGQVRSTRACLLALRLTERYWGGQPVNWPASALPPSPIDDTLLDTVALLTLRDAAGTRDQTLHDQLSRQTTWVAKGRLALRKLLPSRIAMATIYPVQPHSPRVLLWYPVRWWRLLVRRLPNYWRSRQQGRFQMEAGQLAEVQHWLNLP